MSKRRKFSLEFKQGAIEQVRQPGVSCAQVTRELYRHQSAVALEAGGRVAGRTSLWRHRQTQRRGNSSPQA